MKFTGKNWFNNIFTYGSLGAFAVLASSFVLPVPLAVVAGAGALTLLPWVPAIRQIFGYPIVRKDESEWNDCPMTCASAMIAVPAVWTFIFMLPIMY